MTPTPPRKKVISVITLLILLWMNSISTVAFADTFSVNVGQTRQVLLGATILTGKLISGTWTSSDSRVAEITSQSANCCDILGVSKGAATITCRYKYYVGGTIISSSWSCTVNVSGSDDSGDSGSGYMELLFTNGSNKENITLDLANKNSTWLYFYTKPSTYLGVDSEWYDGNFYLSMDVRSGWPQLITYSYDDLSGNGSPVFASNCVRITGKKVGTETVTFQLVHVKNRKFYNTTYGKASAYVSVICSHTFDQGTKVQEASASGNEIWQYTCKHCGETMEKEILPAFSDTVDLILPSNLSEIKANAFEGISAVSVEIPNGCTKIGAYAFKNSSVQQIRIPGDCNIGTDAFSGCDYVLIFGKSGSPAETYALNHENCVFIEE